MERRWDTRISFLVSHKQNARAYTRSPVSSPPHVNKPSIHSILVQIKPIMARINRRKPIKTKGVKPRQNKTDRKELSVVKRAFAAGAVLHGNASQNSTAKLLGVDQGNLSRFLGRLKERSEASGFPIYEETLYENDIGRGRPEKLTQEQKDEIVHITTQDRRHREKQPEQAIKDGDFKHIPEVSQTLFESVMYEAGYSRRKPGFKPMLTEEQRRNRHEWALIHNPDRHHIGDGKGFNFRRVVYTDETPARIGDQRGMKRAWFKQDEYFHQDVKRPKIRNSCGLQFYGTFTYNRKGPCHIYGKESEAAKEAARTALQEENKAREEQRINLVPIARRALRSLGESEANSKAKPWKQSDALKRGDRTRGGVDGYRHREEVLKPLVKPFMDTLSKENRSPILLEDGAAPHKSKIATEYLDVCHIEKLSWPGHSPDINAIEHA